jgi:hypothetical protein
MAQEIVIEPTNGRAQSTIHVSRPAAVQSMPLEEKKSRAKLQPQERSAAATKSTKKATIKQIAASRKVSPVETSPSVSAAPEAAKSETPVVIPPAKKMPARPDWAMVDTRDPRSLQIEMAGALARDPKLASSSIQVKVEDEMVILEGRAAGTEERLQAERLTQSYASNRKLVDHIEIVRPVSAQK